MIAQKYYYSIQKQHCNNNCLLRLTSQPLLEEYPLYLSSRKILRKSLKVPLETRHSAYDVVTLKFGGI